ncbi:unnamed protein product [Amoebophrya sp. A120]|nr:unnamed protein product [Amoebophrya sp. A120]|eukprot:GSA120T00007972001.1
MFSSFPATACSSSASGENNGRTASSCTSTKSRLRDVWYSMCDNVNDAVDELEKRMRERLTVENAVFSVKKTGQEYVQLFKKAAELGVEVSDYLLAEEKKDGETTGGTGQREENTSSRNRIPAAPACFSTVEGITSRPAASGSVQELATTGQSGPAPPERVAEGTLRPSLSPLPSDAEPAPPTVRERNSQSSGPERSSSDVATSERHFTAVSHHQTIKPQYLQARPRSSSRSASKEEFVPGCKVPSSGRAAGAVVSGASRTGISPFAQQQLTPPRTSLRQPRQSSWWSGRRGSGGAAAAGGSGCTAAASTSTSSLRAASTPHYSASAGGFSSGVKTTSLNPTKIKEKIVDNLSGVTPYQRYALEYGIGSPEALAQAAKQVEQADYLSRILDDMGSLVQRKLEGDRRSGSATTSRHEPTRSCDGGAEAPDAAKRTGMVARAESGDRNIFKIPSYYRREEQAREEEFEAGRALFPAAQECSTRNNSLARSCGA